MRNSMTGILLLFRDDICRGQCADYVTEPHHSMAVGDKVVWICFPVAAEVRPVRIIRIRPPVIAFRVKIMAFAGASVTAVGGNGFHWFVQVL